METDNTLSLAESVEEILLLIKTRDTIRDNYNTDKSGNHYLYLVIMSLEITIKNLTNRVQDATR
jgi:hypothetical protein